MQKLSGFTKKATVATLHPKIDLTPCRSCDGLGKRVIHGVDWPCFVCAGSGTVVQHGGRVAA